MKKILFTLLILASILPAQIGPGRNTEGVHVPAAGTLEQGFLLISGSYETVSDGHALAMDGYKVLGTDSTYALDNNTPSSGGAFAFGIGITDNIEFGARLPIYYEGEINGTDLGGFGMGDLQAYLKYSYPIPSAPVNLGILAETSAPTGTRSIGFRPRHQWFVYEEEDSYAFTAGKWTLFFAGLISVNIGDIAHWNTYLGYLHVMEADNHTLLWGSGFELFPKRTVSGIIEVSAETGLLRDDALSSLRNDVLRLTPAVKIHLPNELNLMLGMDIGIDFVRKPTLGNSIEMHRRSGDRNLEYNVRGTPEYSLVLAITKTLDFSRKDSDNDGVIDKEDLCPNTELGVAVNSRGCPVDNDQDGVESPSTTRAAPSIPTATAYPTTWTSVPTPRKERQSTTTDAYSTAMATEWTTSATSARTPFRETRWTNSDAPSTTTMTACSTTTIRAPRPRAATPSISTVARWTSTTTASRTKSTCARTATKAKWSTTTDAPPTTTRTVSPTAGTNASRLLPDSRST